MSRMPSDQDTYKLNINDSAKQRNIITLQTAGRGDGKNIEVSLSPRTNIFSEVRSVTPSFSINYTLKDNKSPYNFLAAKINISNSSISYPWSSSNNDYWYNLNSISYSSTFNHNSEFFPFIWYVVATSYSLDIDLKQNILRKGVTIFYGSGKTTIAYKTPGSSEVTYRFAENGSNYGGAIYSNSADNSMWRICGRTIEGETSTEGGPIWSKDFILSQYEYIRITSTQNILYFDVLQE